MKNNFQGKLCGYGVGNCTMGIQPKGSGETPT